MGAAEWGQERGCSQAEEERTWLVPEGKCWRSCGPQHHLGLRAHHRTGANDTPGPPRAVQPPPFPAEVQPHSPSPSSSRTRSAPPSLLGRLSPARSDLSITRSLLSRDRSLGGQKAGGTRLCVRTTRGAGGKAVPEEHGGGGPRGPGRRESAQDSPGADPASVTQAPQPLELAALSPATLRPDRDSPDRGTLTGARSGASARRRRRPQGCS